MHCNYFFAKSSHICLLLVDRNIFIYTISRFAYVMYAQWTVLRPYVCLSVCTYVCARTLQVCPVVLRQCLPVAWIHSLPPWARLWLIDNPEPGHAHIAGPVHAHIHTRIYTLTYTSLTSFLLFLQPTRSWRCRVARERERDNSHLFLRVSCCFYGHTRVRVSGVGSRIGQVSCSGLF